MNDRLQRLNAWTCSQSFTIILSPPITLISKDSLLIERSLTTAQRLDLYSSVQQLTHSLGKAIRYMLYNGLTIPSFVASNTTSHMVGNPFCLALLWPIRARRDKLCPQFRDRNWRDTNDVRLPCKYPHSKGIYLTISEHKKFSQNSKFKVVKNAKY